MTFIITLLALLMERFFHWQHLRHWRWLNNYNAWLQTRTGTWPSHFILLATILPLVLIVGLVAGLLTGWLHGILKLLFGVLVLLYSLGPDNLWAQAYRCMSDLNKEDDKSGVQQVRAVFDLPVTQGLQALHQVFVSAIFKAANQRIFAVLFWFALIGPMGAVLYRLLEIYSHKATPDIAKMAAVGLEYLDWMPVRVFAFLFALAGNYNKVFAIWKVESLKGVEVNQALLTECGLAALDGVQAGKVLEDGSTEVEALALLDRVFVIWLVVLAGIVLFI